MSLFSFFGEFGKSLRYKIVDPLAVARKTLVLKEEQACGLLSRGRRNINSKAKTLLKKYLTSPKRNKLTVFHDKKNYMPSFLTPYVRKIDLHASHDEIGGRYGNVTKAYTRNPVKTVKLVRKFKHLETLHFSEVFENHLPKTLGYLSQLKNLTLSIHSDMRSKMKPLPKRKIPPHLQKLSLRIHKVEKGFLLLQNFFEYLSLQNGLKEFNFCVSDVSGKLPSLNNLLFRSFQLKNLDKFKIFLQGSVLELFEKPEMIGFLNKVETLFLMPYNDSNKEILLAERAKRILFIPLSLDQFAKFETVLGKCKNLKALYLETTTDALLLENETCCYPELSRFMLKINNFRDTPLPKLEKFCQRIKQLEVFSLSINNMNMNTAQEIQKFKKSDCFSSLKSFSLEASTKSLFNKTIKKYEDEVFDQDVLRTLELDSMKTLESLTLKFTRKCGLFVSEILNEVYKLDQLRELELHLVDCQRGPNPLEIDIQRLANLKDFRFTACLVKGDFESICQQVLKIKGLEILHIVTNLYAEALVDPQAIKDIVMSFGIDKKLKEIFLKDKNQSYWI